MRRQLAGCVVVQHGDDLGNQASTVPSGQVRDEVDGQGDGFADTPMRQPDVGRQHTVSETCQRLLQ